MTNSERSMWVRYRNEHGPLSLAHHINRGFAMLASVLVSLHGVKGSKIEDFMPTFGASKDDRSADDMSIDEMIASAGRLHEKQ